MGLLERVEDKDHLEYPQTPKHTYIHALKKGICEGSLQNEMQRITDTGSSA